MLTASLKQVNTFGSVVAMYAEQSGAGSFATLSWVVNELSREYARQALVRIHLIMYPLVVWYECITYEAVLFSSKCVCTWQPSTLTTGLF